MPSKSLLFLKETGAPQFDRAVSVVHHPEMPSPRYEVLFQTGRPGRRTMGTWWSPRMAEAFRFARWVHEASDEDIKRNV